MHGISSLQTNAGIPRTVSGFVLTKYVKYFLKTGSLIFFLSKATFSSCGMTM